MERIRELVKSRRLAVSTLAVFVVLCSFIVALYQYHLKSVEAAQVTIDSDANTTNTSHLISGSQTVFISDQVGYKFFRDAPGYCVYRKTTDGGGTWSATTTVDSQTDCIMISVWYDRWTPQATGTLIHIATLDTSASDTFYNRLDTLDDSLLLTAGAATSTSLSQGGTIVAGANSVSITRGTDGTVYMNSNDNSDSYVVECSANCRLATSWTETGFSSTTLSLVNNYTLLLPLTNGNIMALMRDVGREDMGSKVWNNAGGTWDAATSTFDLNATDNTTYDIGFDAVVSSTTPGDVYVAYIANNATLGTDDQIRTAKYSNGVWATSTDVVSVTTRGITNVSVALDAANNDVYVAYTGATTPATPTTANVYWHVATSSMRNWGVERGPISTSSANYYGMDINMLDDQRIFATWFHLANADINGDTLIDIHPGINATSTGTQTPFAAASTTNVYIGGKFVVTETYRTNDVTSVTITETGTANAATELDNIRLFYDQDVTTPFDCASESYGGSEPLFGVSDTDGFSSANGTSTFTARIAVSTTSALCLYPVMDLLPITVPSTTLELQIANVARDVTVATSTAGPTSTKEIASTTIIFNNVTATQARYHWRFDTATETAAYSISLGVENTAITEVAQKYPYRLRIGVSNEGGTTTGAMQYRLEYALSTTTCAATAGWTDVGAALGDWDMALSQLVEGSDTTNISSSTRGAVTDDNSTFLTPNGGQRESTSQTGSLTLSTAQFVELEYAIQATASSTLGGTYCFRVTNAGTPIPAYTVYPQATLKYPSDFKVQRGITTVTGNAVTLTAGTDYIAPAASTTAFVRITNTHFTGAGDTLATANQNADDVTAYIINASNITTSFQIGRPTGAGSDTRVAWEIVEYVGATGGDNEIRVRQQGNLTYGGTSFTATTSAVSGIVDDADVAVFITGQANPNTGRTTYNVTLSTSKWNAAADTASFQRGATGDAVITSYAVVEFVGANWIVQRSADHAYSAIAGTTETETITSVGSLSRAFIHAQKRVAGALNQQEDFGHEVWLSGLNQLSMRLDAGANTVTSHVSAAWVIENTQTTGDTMIVTRSNGSTPAGTAPLTSADSVNKTLDDLTIASLFMNNNGSGAATSYPEPMIAAYLVSRQYYETWISNTTDTRTYRTEVVEWPTANYRFAQNYYRFYVNNDALLPTDPWPSGVEDMGENTEITGLDTPITSGETTRIRMSLQVSNATMVPGIDSFKLQYAPRSTTCDAIATEAWQNLGAIGSTTALWRATSTSIVDGTVLSTNPPGGGNLALSVSDVAGTFEEENNTAFTPYLVRAGDDVEYDWAVQNNGAADKTSYCFRMTYANGTEFPTYNFYPTMRTIGYGAVSQTWRWYDDATNETPTSTLAATNTAPIDVDFNNPIVLRMTLREVNGADGPNAKFRLQFSESSSFATSTFVSATTSCTNLSYWCYYDGGGTDNATITTRMLSNATSTCVGGVGTGCGTHNEAPTTTSTFLHKTGAETEFSFTIRSSGARTNRVYYFRAYDVINDEVVPLGEAQSYPSILTKGASLVFAMSGMASSTVTEGVTLDVSTTPSRIAFGSVPQNTYVEAGHRLTVDTNGTQGHQILMMMNGELESAQGNIITPISGTNAVPVAWTTGCAVDASSCFGYHTGDDTLEGDATRFSALDTYARVSTTTLEQVSYNSQPVEGETTDIIFRVVVRELQPAGNYEGSVTYVSVPMF